MSKDRYDPRSYPPFAVAVDIVVLTVDDLLSVLLVERGADPYEGALALPGGFVRPEESIDDAARRVLLEETGVGEDNFEGVHMEQLATFGDPGRDPRMRVVSIVYMAFIPAKPEPTPGTEVAAARWIGVDTALDGMLAFDHAEVLGVGVERARSKLEYTTLATNLAGPEFTMGELQHVYEATWGYTLERANFRRKVLATMGFVTKTRKRRRGDAGGAPAVVYRPGGGQLLQPAMMRAQE